MPLHREVNKGSNNDILKVVFLVSGLAMLILAERIEMRKRILFVIFKR